MYHYGQYTTDSTQHRNPAGTDSLVDSLLPNIGTYSYFTSDLTIAG